MLEVSWKEIKESPNVKIIHHEVNLGVGAATITGFKCALNEECSAVIKMDADGQHSSLYLKDIIPYLLGFPLSKLALIKGSRYLFRIKQDRIPKFRKIGSIFLEPMARVALACRGLTDISNGYIAMNNLTCRLLLGTRFGPKLNNRYLFESSLLVRNNYFDIPIIEFAMAASYGQDW